MNRIRGCATLLLALAAPAGAELLVSAAASLADALPEVAKAWEAQGGERVAFNFAASSTLVSQIEAGAPVDLVFTADEETMERLARGGLLRPESRRAVVGNRLAVIVPAGATYVPARPADLARPELRRLALADPTAVPAGKYARAWLERRGLWAALEPRVLPTLNVRAAVATVASGDADVGVVYTTDVAASRGVRLAFAVAEGEGPRIVYPAAVVAASRRAAGAGRLLDFLAGDAARAVFARFGFADPAPLGPAAPTP